MLRTLVLIVFLSTLSLNAKDMAIQESLNITVPLKKTVILEFPFKIEVTKTPFYTKKKKEKKEIKIVTPSLDGNIQIKNPNFKEKKTQKSFSLKSSDNIINIFSKKEGKTEFTIWGYKHPIIISLDVKKEDSETSFEKYYRFKNIETDRKKAIKFEAVPHERIVIKILKALYNNKVPKGYKVERASLKYQASGLNHTLEKRIVGYNYIGEVWAVRNIDKLPVNLYESKYLSNEIYLVSFEADMLKRNEITRLFIVREQK